MGTGTELQVLNTKGHEQFLIQQRDRIDKWCLPVGNVRAEALTRHVLHEMSLDPKLQSCTPTSIYLSLLACAVTGLPPGKMRGLSFLIPFQNTRKVVDDKGHGREIATSEATFMIGWRGVKLTGFRAGLDMVSDVVKQGDDFDFDKGTSKFLRHKIALKGRGQVIGAYAYAQLPRGGLEIEWMDLDMLGAIERQANARGPSPAWNGPFKDQMQRKSALRRLGKQLEMGEDFLRAELIELGHSDTGSIAGALDVITDGEASRVISASSVESQAFSAAPRPAQVQVAEVVEVRASPAKNQPKTAAGSGKPAVPVSASAEPSGNKYEQAVDKAMGKVEAKAAAAPVPTEASKPAASPNASSSAPSPSTASASPAPTTAAASPSAPPTSDAPELGDVAGEPGPDEAFDTSFGDEDPVDTVPTAAAKPSSRAEWVSAFQAWAAAHPTRASVIADDSWQDLFRGWCFACPSRAELELDKAYFIGWSKTVFNTGRRADPPKGIAAVEPDPGSAVMAKIFAERWKQVS